MHLMGVEAKEAKTKKELVQRLNTKLLQGQMKLHAKVVTTTQQRPAVAWASTSAMGVHPDVMLLKFVTSKDH